MTVITALIAAIAPLTALIASVGVVVRDWRQHRHQVEKDHLQQEHEIISSYLDRALNPDVPLAIRQQLLRFLSTPDRGARKLETWASAELARVDQFLEPYDASVRAAERKLLEARTTADVRAAEAGLQAAAAVRQIASSPPAATPPTPAAIRAGMFSGRKNDLSGMDLSKADLRNANVSYAKLVGANLAHADLTGASLQGCDLRHADLSGAILRETTLYMADMRGACLRDSTIVNDNPHSVLQARLEGADLSGAEINVKALQVFYDGLTRWPEGFDPDEHGAVRVGGGQKS